MTFVGLMAHNRVNIFQAHFTNPMIITLDETLSYSDDIPPPQIRVK